jgi:hypothetical protein
VSCKPPGSGRPRPPPARSISIGTDKLRR